MSAFATRARRALHVTGMAVRALGEQPSRTGLTLLGIVIGIVSLVVMMALIGGLDASVRRATEPFGVGVFTIRKEPRFGQGGLSWAQVVKRPPFKLADVAVLEERLELSETIGAEVWNWGVSFSTKSRQTAPACGIAGTTPAFLDAHGMMISSGRFLVDQDGYAAHPVIVIGSDVVKTLFPSGEREAIGATVRVRNEPYTVIGTFVERPTLFGAAWRNCLAVIPLPRFIRQYGNRSLNLTFVSRDRNNSPAAQEEAISVLRSMREVKPGERSNFELYTNESMGGEFGSLAIVLTIAAGAICLMALLVGGVGVMNVMLVSVLERTREIGIRKALGARPAMILLQFLSEAVLLSSFGGGAGIVLAYGGVALLEPLLGLPASVPLWAAGLALASSSIIGLLAGVYPAARAARLDPIVALRFE